MAFLRCRCGPAVAPADHFDAVSESWLLLLSGDQSDGPASTRSVGFRRKIAPLNCYGDCIRRCRSLGRSRSPARMTGRGEYDTRRGSNDFRPKASRSAAAPEYYGATNQPITGAPLAKVTALLAQTISQPRKPRGPSFCSQYTGQGLSGDVTESATHCTVPPRPRNSGMACSAGTEPLHG